MADPKRPSTLAADGSYIPKVSEMILDTEVNTAGRSIHKRPQTLPATLVLVSKDSIDCLIQR